MDQIFAPWRLDWVTRDDTYSQDDCVFCSMGAAKADKANRILVRSRRTYSIVNKAPYTPGHLMIIPRDHVNHLTSLDSDIFEELFQLTQTMIQCLDETMYPDGYNLGMNIGQASGASIEHLHLHLVPRWNGDTNFMPTTANTSVIVEALDETYARLRGTLTNWDHVSENESDQLYLHQ